MPSIVVISLIEVVERCIIPIIDVVQVVAIRGKVKVVDLVAGIFVVSVSAILKLNIIQHVVILLHMAYGYLN